jgi:DNA-binding transcriptional LysR family regulator
VDDPYVFVCHRIHPLVKKKCITSQDFGEHPLIGIGRAADSGNRALLDVVLGKAKVRLNWVYEVNNFTTALQFIESGLGASVMPRLGSPKRLGSAIATVPIGPMQLSRSIGIVERRKGRL